MREVSSYITLDELIYVMWCMIGCVQVTKGDGLFAPDIPIPTGAARIKQAKDAYASGRTALSSYVNLVNRGLMQVGPNVFAISIAISLRLY